MRRLGVDWFGLRFLAIGLCHWPWRLGRVFEQRILVVDVFDLPGPRRLVSQVLEDAFLAWAQPANRPERSARTPVLQAIQAPSCGIEIGDFGTVPRPQATNR